MIEYCIHGLRRTSSGRALSSGHVRRPAFAAVGITVNEGVLHAPPVKRRHAQFDIYEE
jgi:hypothetical protein